MFSNINTHGDQRGGNRVHTTSSVTSDLSAFLISRSTTSQSSRRSSRIGRTSHDCTMDRDHSILALCLFWSILSIGAAPLNSTLSSGETSQEDPVKSTNITSSNYTDDSSQENQYELGFDRAGLEASDEDDSMELLDDTDFVVRLTRALKSMNYGRLPKTVVLNPKAVIEHTHAELDPAFQHLNKASFAETELKSPPKVSPYQRRSRSNGCNGQPIAGRPAPSYCDSARVR